MPRDTLVGCVASGLEQEEVWWGTGQIDLRVISK